MRQLGEAGASVTARKMKGGDKRKKRGWNARVEKSGEIEAKKSYQGWTRERE